MYVCVCNALTEHRVREAIEAGARDRLVDVYAACGCEAKCGQCSGTILRLMKEYAAKTAPDPRDAA